MGHSSHECNKTVSSISSSQVNSSRGLCVNITRESLESLVSLCEKISDSDAEETYSEPMIWIGVYIAIASWFCILAMLADLLRGFKRKKLWFPCKFFSLNATSVTVITVAMKLPMDLSSPMPGNVDQASKLGSMMFMCVMVTNLMPSIASMDNKSLVTNVVGLVILVITMIVNICIQISTGVIHHNQISIMANIYVTFTFLLLVILISSSITIPTCKKILEIKYRVKREKALVDQDLLDARMSTVEKLRIYVTRYWVMTETGDPQFVMASNPLSFGCGVICVVGVVLYVCLVLPVSSRHSERAYGSVYKSTTNTILITQSIGIIVGTIAPIFRCYIVLKWKILIFLKVEDYWTQKLCKWKEKDIPFLSSNSRSRPIVQNLKNHILSLWIVLQKAVVIFCKMIALSVVYCSNCWNSMRSNSNNTSYEDVKGYVLQLQDDIQPTQETLIGITKPMNQLLQKAKKKQKRNLLKFLEKSTGFEGVKSFDNDQVHLLFSPQLLNTWSLPLVTLTCIAITLPSIRKKKARSLLASVSEGLRYTRIVEECLNTASEYVDIQRATVSLWREVEGSHKWLENTLETHAFKGKTPVEILTWFADKSQEIVIEIINKSFNGESLVHHPPQKLIAANSMYRIAQTILFNCRRNLGVIREKEVFEMLCGMIADILAACLTNIPQVITTKLNESVSEASVEAATTLLGRTAEIIRRLEMRELQRMDPNKMASIDEWRLHLNQQ